MTQKDIDWVFEWTQIILDQAKWCQKAGTEKVMEMARQSLEKHLDELIVPCGSSWGVLQGSPDSESNDYWRQRDDELKKQYFEDIKPFDKYWVNHER